MTKPKFSLFLGRGEVEVNQKPVKLYIQVLGKGLIVM